MSRWVSFLLGPCSSANALADDDLAVLFSPDVETNWCFSVARSSRVPRAAHTDSPSESTSAAAVTAAASTTSSVEARSRFCPTVAYLAPSVLKRFFPQRAVARIVVRSFRPAPEETESRRRPSCSQSWERRMANKRSALRCMVLVERPIHAMTTAHWRARTGARSIG